ncbi:MAG: cytochrome c maturation protein CcmE [Rhodospirillaceae bacterium]|nr:cytochrome c maturation protein CcmE [Rhodospirillaceae bacterium]
MKAKHKRLFFVGFGVALLAGAVALALVALQDTVTFFFTPSQAAERAVPAGQRVRLGGLVEEKSVRKLADGVTIEFRVTDRAKAVTVRYKGVLPDLFREGQGVVIQGTFQPDRIFAASTVLAKHDENYMPKEVAEELKKQGMWQHTKDKPPAAK